MPNAKVKMLKTGVRLFDTRSVKPLPKRADAELGTVAHQQWRTAVKARAGWQCEWVDENGRCQVRAPQRLFADHIIERQDGGDPLDVKNGQCLCGSHHTEKTVRERAKRLAASP